MNHDSYERSELSDFEERLKSLAPRAPLAHGPVLAGFEEHTLVEPRSAQWTDSRHGRRAFYRTVAASASLGALLGAACMLLIVRWTSLAPHSVPVAVVAAAPHAMHTDTVHTPADLKSQTSPAEQEAKELLTDLPAPTGIGVEQSVDWLEELRNLRPGTLGVGTRLVSQLAGGKSVQYELDRSVAWGDREVASYATSEMSNVELRSSAQTQATLPQREWMQRMLSSPREFF